MTKINPIAKALRTPKFKPLVMKNKKREYVRREKHQKLSEAPYRAPGSKKLGR